MEHRIRDCWRHTDYCQLGEPFDAQGIDMRIVLVHEEGLERRDVSVDRYSIRTSDAAYSAWSSISATTSAIG
jgi:hypothetical protein